MSRKKTVWFEVEENENAENCLTRMAAEGYSAVGRKEEPLFREVDGEIVPFRQLIKFKGMLLDEN